MPQIKSVSGNKTLYYESRSQAGIELAKKLDKYKNESTAVLALSKGGVLVLDLGQLVSG